ncbi:universal stress protein [Janibacter cremeus]|uniref:universal stress protein n=1 Tax=Janibacter cremeus TaxID=1285192 RepID=UPI00163DB9C3|nr:universal stress protein [Janibacter cremeus]
MTDKPITVGVDGSADSVRALRWAADYAQLVGAPVVALTAWDLETVYGRVVLEEWESKESVEGEARNALADAVREALGDDARVEQRTVRGHPAQVVAEATERAQLVVVGSRGRGGFASLMLGSVSQHVVTHAACPVVVMPHEDPPSA